jgi:uridine kinase
MVRLGHEKRLLLDAIAEEFLGNYAKGRTMIAIDGVDATSEFADALATRLAKGRHAVFRASLKRFFKPKAERHARGLDAADGDYNGAFDYDLVRRVLIDPFKLGGSAGFVTAAFDADRDAPVTMQWKTGPQDATLIVDGPFLNRPELRGLWNYSVWLDESGELPPAHKLYLAEANPRARASAIVDYRDPGHPTRLFADSC